MQVGIPGLVSWHYKVINTQAAPSFISVILSYIQGCMVLISVLKFQHQVFLPVRKKEDSICQLSLSIKGGFAFIFPFLFIISIKRLLVISQHLELSYMAMSISKLLGNEVFCWAQCFLQQNWV